MHKADQISIQAGDATSSEAKELLAKRSINHPYHPLPNVRKFKIKTLSNFHPILSKYGIEKREFSPLIESEKYNNGKLNKYVRYQFERLNRSRGNSALYWTIANQLQKQSNAYLIMSINAVIPNWHRRQPYGKMWELIKECDQLRRRDYLSEYQYKLLTIPKGNGENRLIGIPKLKYRILLHGLNNLLVTYLGPSLNSNQHGFLPGKGSDSAWQKIHHEILKSPNIYEFDLKTFFDKIELTYLMNILRSKLPQGLADSLETLLRKPATNDGLLGNLQPNWDSPHQEASSYQYSKTGVYHIGTLEEATTWIEKKRSDPEHNQHSYKHYKGVPQGNPLSPFLSLLVLDATILKPSNEYKCIMYADDGLLYDYQGDILSKINLPKESGLEFNLKPTKSKYVKINNNWQSSLKFLGRIFIPEQYWTPELSLYPITQGGWLSNSTRTPKDYTIWEQNIVREAEFYDANLKCKPNLSENIPRSFKEWFETKYYGFLMSRLQNGLNLEEIVQDFSYKFDTWSWSDLESRRRTILKPYIINGHKEENLLTTFNSSSFACCSVARRLRYHQRQVLTSLTPRPRR